MRVAVKRRVWRLAEGGEHVEAFGEVGQHAAGPAGEEAVGFVEDDKFDAPETADRVLA